MEEAWSETPYLQEVMSIYLWAFSLIVSTQSLSTIYNNMPPQLIEISGTTLDRYIQGATLLRLLDPVRGDPTSYGLDQEARTIQAPFDRIIKRKFLDAIALICASEKGSDSISAACFDLDDSEGTVIRIASNGGVSNRTISYLDDLLGALTGFSTQGRLAPPRNCVLLTWMTVDKSVSHTQLEIEVLKKIIRLVNSRIQAYITEFQKLRVLPRKSRADLQADIAEKLPRLSSESVHAFLDWFCQIEGLINLRPNADSDVLFGWVRWTERARTCHMEILRAGFSSDHNSFPKWATYIFKVSRYGAAAKCLVKAAMEVPSLFESISVKAISAPQLVRYRVSASKQPLISMLRRIPGIEPDSALHELARMWNTTDPEKLFREKCKVDLAVHAELQILRFYDENEQVKPRNRFIGVSKKSCYLCSTFLAYHTAGFVTSSCHQKMYLSIPPPSTNPKIYRRFKDLTSQICVRMESMAKEDLIARLQLGLDRRSPVADSTAGISYAESLLSRSWEQFDINVHVDFAEVSVINTISVEESGIGPQEPLTIHGTSEQSRMSAIASDTCMVFHFVTVTGQNQELFMVDDILDPTTSVPSWQALSRLLCLPPSTILCLQATNPPRIDATYRIYNQRQLNACIQYLSNSGILNVEIRAYGETLVADIADV